MTALLALAREAGGTHLLDVAGSHGDHRGHTDDGEDHTDPPVPDIRSNHVISVARKSGRSHFGPEVGVVRSAALRASRLVDRDDEFVESVHELLEVRRQLDPFVGVEGVHDETHGILATGKGFGMAGAPSRGSADDHDALVVEASLALGETDAFETLHGSRRRGRIDAKCIGEVAHAPPVLLDENVERVHLPALESVVTRTEEIFGEAAHRRAAPNLAKRMTDTYREIVMRRIGEIEWAGGRHGVCRVLPVEPPLHALGVIASQSVMVTPSLRHVELFTMRGLVTVLWHHVPAGRDDLRVAIVACGGAMGGLLGPADGLYQGLGDVWADRGVSVLRVSYRRPNDLDACCLDVAATVQLAVESGAERVVVMGHSFGGAVAVRVAVVMDEVVGVVTFATQSAGCEVAPGLRGRPLLLFHGDADEILPLDSSRIVAAMAGVGDVVVCEGDGHLLAKSGSLMWDRLESWLPETLGLV